MKLTNALVQLVLTTTTLVTDLYDAEVDGVGITDTNNTPLSYKLDEKGWGATIGFGDYAMVYSQNGTDAYLPTFDVNMVDAQDNFIGFMGGDEEDIDNFTKTVATIPTLVAAIDNAYLSLKDNEKELTKQFMLAKAMSHIFVINRWLEHIEAIGLDEEVSYTPQIDISLDGRSVAGSIEMGTNAFGVVSTPNDKPKVRGYNQSLDAYIDLVFKDEGETPEKYWIDTHSKQLEHTLNLLWEVL